MKQVIKSFLLFVVCGPALVWAIGAVLTLNFSVSDYFGLVTFVYMLAIGPALATWLFDLLLKRFRYSFLWSGVPAALFAASFIRSKVDAALILGIAVWSAAAVCSWLSSETRA
jgi:hypothetical protein